MNCENNYCVYNSENKCILDEISIDAVGMCAECIYPNIDKQILDKYKNKFLNCKD